MNSTRNKNLQKGVFHTTGYNQTADSKVATESEDTTSSPSPVLFWKPTQTYGYLGQWHMSSFTDPSNNQTFNCAEQYMMYHKAILFNDLDVASQIMQTDNPRQHKSLGARVKNFSDKAWNKEKTNIVENGNWLKFTQSEELKTWLLSTGESELVEASPYDRIWGIGFMAGDALKVERSSWGENLLGKVLMRVRDRLRAKELESVAEKNDLQEKVAE
ncbi:uncharacterized protein RHO25_004130 [Cercospora beticola]|uniref:NADAR domain-containing protein n=2 Tax=Cercospora beticola TaxID=122368 RepID=A0ABZ0NJ07_CERBT|nr:hypothetical protein RHO25_004130 [Cercospora beticola]